MPSSKDVCEKAKADLCTRLSGSYYQQRNQYSHLATNLNAYRDVMASQGSALKTDGCGGFGAPQRYEIAWNKVSQT